MYLRSTQRKNRDGSIVRYLSSAHNRRVEGVTQAEVLLNLGREDLLDRDGLHRLVGGAASELEKASTMHAAGRLSDDEYAALKAKILA